jgi:tetratricopeptide (TPR) repeat protein
LRYYMNREWDRANEHYRKALELEPHSHLAHILLAFPYIQTGKLTEGIRVSETAVQVGGRSAMILGMLGYIYAKAGRSDEARDLLKELYQLAQKRYVPPSSFARIYLGLNETERTFDWLEKAAEEQEGAVLHLSALPYYDTLRRHPRYKALLRKMNLEA